MDVQDSKTRTIDWLMQMDDASDGDAAANGFDGLPVMAMDALLTESDVSVTPNDVCEGLSVSGSTVYAAQLPSPEFSAEGVAHQGASSPPSSVA